MLRGVVTYAPYSHHFEVAPVCPHNVVTSCLHRSALYHQRPRLHLPVPTALPEVEEEVHKPEIHQQVSNLLAARVLGLDDVGAEVPQYYDIVVPEACQGLLQVR